MAVPRKRNRNTPAPGSALRRLMSLADWPFDEFSDDSLFGETWAPAVNLKENKDGYVVQADIPGVEPKDIEVTLDNGILTIRGERREEHFESGDSIHREERFAGSFARRFSLPDAADDGVEARMNHGVLEIRVPKSERATARRIEIKS